MLIAPEEKTEKKQESFIKEKLKFYYINTLYTVPIYLHQKLSFYYQSYSYFLIYLQFFLHSCRHICIYYIMFNNH